MGLFDIFKSKKEEPKSRVTKEISKKEVVEEKRVEDITNEAELAEIAKTGTDDKKRIIAIKKISDQSLLSYIAINDNSNEVSEAAAQQITDQNLLVEIAKTSKKYPAKEEALKKITIQDALIEILKTEENSQLRKTAVRNITDQSVLSDIALNDNSQYVRKLAFSLISDQAVLVDIFKNNSDPSSRKNALMMINDTGMLLEIENGDADETFKKIAGCKLQWLAHKEELFAQLQSGQMADAVRNIVKTFVGYIDSDELYEWVKSACTPMNRDAAYAMAKEFRYFWSPGDSTADEIHTLFTSIEKIASKKELMRKEGDIREGFIVRERFLDNNVSPEKSKLRSFAQSEQVKKDIIVSGFAGWTVYSKKETAIKIKDLLKKAGSQDSTVKRVRVFMSPTDPRITEKAQSMENGVVLEYLE